MLSAVHTHVVSSAIQLLHFEAVRASADSHYVRSAILWRVHRIAAFSETRSRDHRQDNFCRSVRGNYNFQRKGPRRRYAPVADDLAVDRVMLSPRRSHA